CKEVLPGMGGQVVGYIALFGYVWQLDNLDDFGHGQERLGNFPSMTAARLIVVRDDGNPFTLERFGVGIIPNISATGIGRCNQPLSAKSFTILFTLDYENGFSLYQFR